MSEKVVIPDAEKIKTIERTQPKGSKEKFKLYKPASNGVAPMPAIGDGYNVHVTGLTHDEKGYPVMSVETQEEMMNRLIGKIRNNIDDITITEEFMLDDAEIVIVSYGVASRTSYTVVETARKMGYKVGLLKLVTVWPFPDKIIKKLAKRVKGFITVEINLGQIVREVQRCAGTAIPSYSAGHSGGAIVPPEDVLKIIEEDF